MSIIILLKRGLNSARLMSSPDLKHGIFPFADSPKGENQQCEKNASRPSVLSQIAVTVDTQINVTSPVREEEEKRSTPDSAEGPSLWQPPSNW